MRHISCIDNFDNLKALVRQDLRELGVKVPKNKKSKKQTGRNPHSQNKEKVIDNIFLMNIFIQETLPCMAVILYTTFLISFDT